MKVFFIFFSICLCSPLHADYLYDLACSVNERISKLHAERDGFRSRLPKLKVDVVAADFLRISCSDFFSKEVSLHWLLKQEELKTLNEIYEVDHIQYKFSEFSAIFGVLESDLIELKSKIMLLREKSLSWHQDLEVWFLSTQVFKREALIQYRTDRESFRKSMKIFPSNKELLVFENEILAKIDAIRNSLQFLRNALLEKNIDDYLNGGEQKNENAKQANKDIEAYLDALKSLRSALGNQQLRRVILCNDVRRFAYLSLSREKELQTRQMGLDLLDDLQRDLEEEYQEEKQLSDGLDAIRERIHKTIFFLLMPLHAQILTQDALLFLEKIRQDVENADGRLLDKMRISKVITMYGDIYLNLSQQILLQLKLLEKYDQERKRICRRALSRKNESLSDSCRDLCEEILNSEENNLQIENLFGELKNQCL